MNERKLSNFCLLLLAFSMLLRLICATGADARMAAQAANSRQWLEQALQSCEGAGNSAN